MASRKEDDFSYLKLADPVAWKRAQRELAWAKKWCKAYENAGWWSRKFSPRFTRYDYGTIKAQTKLSVFHVYVRMKKK